MTGILIEERGENMEKEPKRYLIATACNQKYEDFLVNDWLRSLKENVDLEGIDILVMDYGLSPNACSKLTEQAVIVKEAKHTKGLINNMRFIELSEFLKSNPQYEQVILCDSGDIIFQSDISMLFELESEKIRAVCESISPNMDVLVNDKVIENATEIKNFLRENKLMNVGFVVYPTNVFLDMCGDIFILLKDVNVWGAETILINYFAYKNGFYELHQKYNFIPTTSTLKYVIKDGKFYLSNGEIIPVVHNAGGKEMWRPIENFGYGHDHNIPRPMVIFFLRTFYKSLSLLRKFVRVFERS
ncbi:MAG TPA: hypothetical protein DE117_05430 [Fervidobacterium sp.]|nr:hypothetical protein [Fervidobacterium sp.]